MTWPFSCDSTWLTLSFLLLVAHQQHRVCVRVPAPAGCTAEVRRRSWAPAQFNLWLSISPVCCLCGQVKRVCPTSPQRRQHFISACNKNILNSEKWLAYRGSKSSLNVAHQSSGNSGGWPGVAGATPVSSLASPVATLNLRATAGPVNQEDGYRQHHLPLDKNR